MIALASPDLERLLGTWSVDPGLIATLAGSGAVYVGAARRARGGWPRRRTISFLSGLLTLAVALLSGIDGYADELLSVHMVQHMLLLMVAPVALVWAAPVRLALASCPRGGRRAIGTLLHHRAVRLLSRPVVGVTALVTVILVTYFTPLFELSLRDPTVHAVEHAAFFWSGVLCFAPLIAADPLPRPPSAVARLAWLMATMTAMVIVGAVLTFQTTVRYPHYIATARALHISALADQQLAGAIMWIGGGMVGAAITLAVVMSALLAEERRQQRRDLYAPASRPGEPPWTAGS